MKNKVFVVGDSISIYYGPYLQKMITGRFSYDRKRGETTGLDELDNAESWSIEKCNEVNGGDSRCVLEFLARQNELGKMNYDILLLNAGLHDIRTDTRIDQRQIGIGEYESNLKKIIGLARENRVDIVWVRTTPVKDDGLYIGCVGLPIIKRFNHDVDEYNRAADLIMKQNEIPVIDLNHFTAAFGDDSFWDHCHFKREFWPLQAAFIAGHLFALYGRA